MPRLSDTMEEGNIVAWLKKVGDKVAPGDILAEVETDKATMELESFHEGYLLYISVEKGPVPVNEILAVIGEKNEDYKAAISSSSNGNQPQPAAEPENKPDTSAEKKKQEEPVEAKETTISEKTEPVRETETQTAASESRIKSSPLAKTIAADAGIDLKSVKGTGDGGRIVKRDVEGMVSASQAKGAKTDAKAEGQYTDAPLSQIRKTIAKRLVESKFSAPHFYLTMKINMDKTSEARKLINDQSGLKISFNDFVLKACAHALRLHPAVNSSWMGDRIRTNNQINIGVAVAVDEGLLVPVLTGVDQMKLSEISNQVNVLAEKARQKKLQLPEMQGNTFTVSNLGMFGIDEFTAIINPPDSAIMAVGTIGDELSMVDGELISSKIMKITLSCDHRVIDGATGAKFLQTFKQLMENPVSMLV